MSPRVRQQIRLIAGVWLAWTVAGLFYITQDSVPRLYRGERVPWKYVFVGWMAGMYVCAALTPALLWLGNRWPVERRVAYAGLHLCFSVVFSILATAIEVPVLLLLGVFPAATPPPSIAAGVRVMLSFGIQGGVIRYWAVIALQAVYRSQKNAKIREREAFELRVQASELAQQLATAQLSALKMQLQPHFLFNTLGAIIVLDPAAEDGAGRSDGREARRSAAPHARRRGGAGSAAVARAGVPAAVSLDRAGPVRGPAEGAHRAGSRLSDVLVPHMVLQPIVENAVRHGLGQSEEAVTIEVERDERERLARARRVG